MKKKKKQPEKFDPQALVTEKLDWAGKAILDAAKVARYYGMPPDVLDRLALHVACPEAVGVVDHEVVFDAVRDRVALVILERQQASSPKLDVDPEIMANLKAALDDLEAKESVKS